MAAQLHHEPIASGAPTAWMIVLHGILGAGGNWRGIARKVVERRPDWGLVLVDLRHHGRSAPGAPPNTLAACAEDVHALAGVLGATLGPVHAIAGHSFGGKVALATRAFGGLRQTWMFDSSPAPGRIAPAIPPTRSPSSSGCSSSCRADGRSATSLSTRSSRRASPGRSRSGWR